MNQQIVDEFFFSLNHPMKSAFSAALPLKKNTHKKMEEIHDSKINKK